MITLERSISFSKVGSTSKQKSERQIKATRASVPRISRLMALAIRFDDLIRGGVVKDQAELARLGYVSRARITQIMDLLQLAPDIQDQVLFLRIQRGSEPIQERELRQIASIPDWQKQWRLWNNIFKPGCSHR